MQVVHLVTERAIELGGGGQQGSTELSQQHSRKTPSGGNIELNGFAEGGSDGHMQVRTVCKLLLMRFLLLACSLLLRFLLLACQPFAV